MSPQDSQPAGLLSEIVAEYPAPGELDSSEDGRNVANFPELQDLFRQAAQRFEEVVSSNLNEEWSVDYGFGQDSLAHIPYIAVFRTDVTDSTQRGVYIVYLFDPIRDAVYLTLNQGALEMNRLRQSDDVDGSTADLLFQQAEYYRGMPESGEYSDISEPWKVEPAQLSSTLRQADKYNNATILHTSYSPDSLSDEIVLREIIELIQIYDSFIDITYDQLRIGLENRRAYAMNIPSIEEWNNWVEEGYAVTGIGDETGEISAISPDDVLIAGRTDNITDYVLGIGVVQEPLSDDDASSLRSTAENLSLDPADGRLYPIEWKSFYSGGVPVTVPRSTDKIFNQSQAHPLSSELVDRLVSAVGHRYGAIENQSTRSLAKSLLEGISIADDLHHVELETTVEDGDDTDELHQYWSTVDKKREFAQRFLESPQRETFARLVDPDHFWATQAFGSLEYYLDELVFAEQTPQEVANAIDDTVDGGLQHDSSLEAVLELDGFGWPVATEILRALRPDEFAILNSQAAQGMSALGYTSPKIQTANVEDYINFVQEVKTAVRKYELRTKVTQFTGETVPDWTTDLEVGDRAFTLHVSEGLGLDSYTAIDEEDAVVDTWSAPKDIFGEERDLAAISSLLFPGSGEDDESITLQIDNALRSGKHIILTGPPGSGKTELAKQICEHYVDKQYALVTATDDWSTFDTIGGYQPEKNQQLTFRPGIFLQRFLRQTDPPRPTNEWLIIDELNRADIDKAFGSLFSALTGNNVTLPFENEGGQIKLVGDPASYGHKPVTSHHYYIPQDWRMIATMNTRDKSSLYRMSYAFMRRFAHISVPAPSEDEIDADLLRNYASEGRWDLGFKSFVDVNEDHVYADTAAIWQAVQRRRPIGPAIIKDLMEHIEQQSISGKGIEYGQPVATYLIPQLEGLSKPDVSSMLDEIEARVERFNRQIAEQFAADYLDMNFEA